MKRIIVALLAVLLFASPALSKDRTGSFEASASVGVSNVINQDDFAATLDDWSETYEAGLAYVLAQNHAVSVNASFSDFDQSFRAVSVNYSRLFRANSNLVPFVSVGYGLTNQGIISTDVKQILNANVGAKLHVGNRLGLFGNGGVVSALDRDANGARLASYVGKVSAGVFLRAR